MTTRERFAWCAFAMTAAALAAVVIMRTGEPGQTAARSPIASASDAGQLARIDARLTQLESLLPATSGASTPTEPRNSAAGPSDAGPGIAPQPSPEQSPPASATSEQIRLAGIALVEHAIQAGYWSRKDAETWRAIAGSLRGEDRFALQRRLITEMNADRLRMEPGASPL